MKVLVLGSSGLVGRAVTRNLQKNSNINLFPATRNNADLFIFNEVNKLIETFNPDILINCAAKVGGILANNNNRLDFILENLKININVLESLIQKPEIKLINLGSSCIYPLNATNPIKEESLMTGKLEPTNSPYAMAKLTAIEIGESLNFQYGNQIINLMPTNLYGPYDNFSPNDSHVIPGLIYKLHKAKIENLKYFEVWGTGKPLREFLHVDDLADCISFIIENSISSGIYNIGSGKEVTIEKLVDNINKIIKFQGKINYNSSFPDGNPRKLLDSSKIFNLGWSPKIDLEIGLKSTYEWFLKNYTF